MNDQYMISADSGSFSVHAISDGRIRRQYCEFTDQDDLEMRSDMIRRQLDDLGYDGRAVLLAVPSWWCLCAVIPTEGMGRRGRKVEMGFVMEEYLPVSIESVVADYIDLPGDEALGVCCELEKLRPLIDALEQAGVSVGYICPAALLAASWVSTLHSEADGAVVRSSGQSGSSQAGYDFIELQKARPSRWWWLADDQAALADGLQRWQCRCDGCDGCDGCDDKSVLAILGSGPDEELTSELFKNLETISLCDTDADDAAALMAERILQCLTDPWINLRCGPLAAPGQLELYRKPLGALVGVIVFLLLSICVVAQWRGRQYAALGDQARSGQVDIFRKALPDQRAPSFIKGRLSSEYSRLSSLGGRNSGDSDSDELRRVSALQQLAIFLESLPANIRLRILDIGIQPDMLRIEGQARSHADAESISVALRDAGGYVVEPPRTQALNGKGVSFVFTARPATDAALQKGRQKEHR